MKYIFTTISFLLPVIFFGQTCINPAGDQTTYGINNTWIGYVYDSLNFTRYHGYITAGNPSSPNFEENFGGDYDSIRPMGGCPVYNESFSIRFKLQQNFAPANYDILVGGDDGYRLSVDGGNTWIINDWSDHAFRSNNVTVFLSGLTNLVLEYYEHEIINRVSFEMHPVCNGTGAENTYGINNQWNGFVYNDTNFVNFRGQIFEGSPSSPNFYEDFGTTEGFANTIQCKFIAETFSVRFLLKKQFIANDYTFTVGGDDGYRLSFDGGKTWAIENYGLHSYVTSTRTLYLSGSYDMVLEYFDFAGDNIVSFEMQQGSLPVKLTSFEALPYNASQNILKFSAVNIERSSSFTIERSKDGQTFESIGSITGSLAGASTHFTFIDEHPVAGNNFYRIKMKETAGISYSSIRMVANSSAKNLSIFPNPIVNRAVYFNAPASTLQVRLVDVSGKVLYMRSFTHLVEGQMIDIQLPAFIAKGTYLISIMEVSGNSYNQKINVE